MKIVCISDTHSVHRKLSLPPCDLLIHAGDFTNAGRFSEVEDFVKWLANHGQIKHKVIIAGNHDIFCQNNSEVVEDLCKTYNIHYLNQSGVEIMGKYIWGSPYTPEFGHGWAFQLKRDSGSGKLTCKEHWKQIPDRTDIVVSHGPPLGVADEVDDMYDANNRICVGDLGLLARLKVVRPKYHICGHIHGGFGVHATDFDTIVVNAACQGDSTGKAHWLPTVIHL